MSLSNIPKHPTLLEIITFSALRYAPQNHFLMTVCMHRYADG